MLEFLAQCLNLVMNALVVPAVWLFPLKWTIVKPGEVAVRYTFGRPGPDLETGWRVCTSCQTIVKEHALRNVAATERVTGLTRDGIALGADAVVIYDITDLGAFLASSDGPTVYVLAIVEACVRRILANNEFQTIAEQSSSMEEELRGMVMDDLKGCGVSIRCARFQKIEHEDPYSRMACAMKATCKSIAAAAKATASELNVPVETALLALSQNVQPIVNVDQPKNEGGD
jgi:regulator of protease activity HflC (stomatin/prohibitin superfamily)